MFQGFKNIKIRRSLIGTFSVLIGSFVLISILVQISQNDLQSKALEDLYIEQRIADLSVQSQNGLSMARRTERDYLLRNKSSEFDNARGIYVDKVKHHITLIHNYMSEIRSLEKHEGLISLTRTADQILEEYKTTFLSVVDLFEKLGFKDSGIEGKFREKIHAIEKAVQEKNLDKLTILMLTIRRHEKDYLLREDKKYIDMLHATAGQFKTAIQASEISTAEKEHLISLLGKYQIQFNEFVEIKNQITASIENYHNATHTLEPWFEEIRIESMKQVHIAWDNAHSVAKRTVWIISIIGILLIILSIGIAIFMANFINRPLALIMQGAKSLTKGDIALANIDYTELERVSEYRNEIGEISSAFKKMSEYLGSMISDIVQVSEGLAESNVHIMPQAEYQGHFSKIKVALEKAVNNLSQAISKNTRQDWLNTGQMQLNTLMSGEQDMANLAKNIISFLTPYVEAKIGLFYSLQESENDSKKSYLTLIASYAYTANERTPTKFKLGEGLVGQAALDKKMGIRVYESQEYKQIMQSGLTRAISRYVYFFPFLHEDSVRGVIEIGSFNELTEFQREFLEQVMISIGIAVNTAESRQKMEILIQKMQEQSEELLEQKEELRQTNEQLEDRALALEESKNSRMWEKR
jgi:methyl-accepting chemotaxis protein